MRDKRTNPRLKPSLCKCIAPFSPPAVFHRRRRRIRLKFGYRFVINILMIVQRTRFRNPFQSFFTFSLFLFSKGSGGSFRSAAGQDVLFRHYFSGKNKCSSWKTILPHSQGQVFALYDAFPVSPRTWNHTENSKESLFPLNLPKKKGLTRAERYDILIAS